MAREPKAEVEISAHSRGLGAKLREARAKFGAFGAELKKRVFGKDLVEKGFFGKAGASMVGNLGANVLGTLGGILAEQGKAALAFEDQLNRLQIAADKTPEEMRAFAAGVRAASNETGVAAEQVLAGAAAYVRLTGDMDGAIAKQRTFARVAQATGSSVGDIAQTAAALKKNLGIGDADTETAFSALAAQGKAGAIELNDLATQMANIAPLWKLFKGGGDLRGLKELGAALQVVKGGFGGDASQTVTGVQSLLVAFQQNGRKIEKAIGKGKVFDVDPKTGAKTMRNVFDIVDAIGKSRLAKDPTLLVKALGRVEAYRAYQQLVQNRAELDRLVDVASDAGLIQRDLQARLDSSAGKTAVAWETAKNKIAEAFTPDRLEAFTGLVVTLTKALAVVADKVGAVLEGAERFGTGLGMLLYGDTEEMKATKAANAARDERVLQKLGLAPTDHQRRLAKIAGLTGDKRLRFFGASDEKIANARRAIGLEDADARLIAEGHRLSGSTKEGGYTIPELGALRRQVQGAGYTNEGMITRAIDDRIRALIGEQTKKLVDAIQGVKTVVQADGKAIADVTRNSSRARGRPGG